MTGEIFRVYLQQCLAPSLKPGDIVVMDNLPAHKNDNFLAGITQRKAKLNLLLPNSVGVKKRPGHFSQAAHCNNPR